jgi:hypothetical protein
MSYWVSLVRNLDGQEYEVFEVGNYTSNVSEMWRKALEYAGHEGGLVSLHGVVADPIHRDVLQEAVRHMRKFPDEFRAMEPENRWGDYDGALAYLEKLLLGCRLHPLAIISVSC